MDLEICCFGGIILAMSEGTETERKFLVDRIPEDLGEGVVIAQGYLHIGREGNEVRLRRKGREHFLTFKSGGDLQRKEREFRIYGGIFSVGWLFTKGRRVEKTRYKISYGSWTVELDVFMGRLSGLMTAEVEFDSIEQSGLFVPPEFFGKEVTRDQRYKNQQLALHGIPE